MEVKGVGNRVSIQPFEMKAGLDLQKRMGRLGVSRRIVTASDDPSGAGISARMQARSNSFAQSRRNASAGMDLARTAGGALDGVSENLGRLRELATQAANGTLNDKDRANLDNEFQSLKEAISSQMETKFGDQELFSGDAVGIVVDPSGAAAVDVQLPDATDLANIEALDVASSAGAEAALAEIDAAFEAVAEAQAELGASDAALGSSLHSAATSEVQSRASESRIADADVAKESAALTAADLMQQAVVAMQIHQGLDGPQVADLLSAPF